MHAIRRLSVLVAGSLALYGSAFAMPHGPALTISLDGNVPTPRGRQFSFNLDASGANETIKFPKVGGGIIAADLDNNGVIANGTEVPGPISGNPCTDVAAYDSNEDGWVNALDANWSTLRIWTKDSLHNDVLLSMAGAGVAGICVYSGESPSGNEVMAFARTDGTFGFLAPVDMEEFPQVDMVTKCDKGDPKGTCLTWNHGGSIECSNLGAECTNNEGEKGKCTHSQPVQGHEWCICSGGDTSPAIDINWMLGVGAALTLVSFLAAGRAKSGSGLGVI